MNKPKIKSWAHLLGFALCLAAAVYVVARQGLSITEKMGAIAVLFAALKTGMGQILQHVDQAIDELPDDEPPAKLGPPSSSTPVVMVLLTGLLLSSSALAQTSPIPSRGLGCVDDANTYCIVPGTAVGDQLNLANGTIANAVMLIGLEVQHEFGSLPLGVGGWIGMGKSTNNQGSYQLCGGVSITNWGLVCAGAQRASFSGGGTTWQGMLTFAGKLTFGATPSRVASQGAR